MSGHSKWANIKHRKSKVDAQRGKLFTKIGREILLAAKAGGGDPNTNQRLKTAIARAREANMPVDNIQRCVLRGTGELDSVSFEEITYEGYGPGGVAILLNIATDNRNRTAPEIRHLFSRAGGSLGESGCVAWMFKRRGVLTIDLAATGRDEDELLLLALDAGAEDVEVEDGTAEIYTQPEDFEQVKESLSGHGISFVRSEISMIPDNTIEVGDGEQAATLLRLMDALEDHDDVQDVYANFDIPEELLESM